MMMNLWWRTMMMNKPWFKKNPRTTFHPGRSRLLVIIGDLEAWSQKLPDSRRFPPHLIGFGRSELRETIPGAREEFHSIHGTSGIDFLGLQLVPRGTALEIYIYIFLYKNTCSITYIYDLYVYNLHIKKNTKNAYLIVFMRTWKLCLSLSLSQAAWFQAISCAEENVHVWFISVYKHVATISFVSFWDLITLALTIGSNHFCFKSKFNPPSWAAFLAEVALIHPYSSHHVFFWGVTEISMKERMSMW